MKALILVISLLVANNCLAENFVGTDFFGRLTYSNLVIEQPEPKKPDLLQFAQAPPTRILLSDSPINMLSERQYRTFRNDDPMELYKPFPRRVIISVDNRSKLITLHNGDKSLVIDVDNKTFSTKEFSVDDLFSVLKMFRDLNLWTK